MTKRDLITKTYSQLAWMVDDLDFDELTDDEAAEAIAEACLTYASVYAAMYDISEGAIQLMFQRVMKASYKVVGVHQDSTEGEMN